MVKRSYRRERPPAPAIYVLLWLYIAMTCTYQIVASVSLIIGYFDLRSQIQAPFETDYLGPEVTTVTDPAKRAGLRKGDVILSLNGQPYRGRALWQSQRWYARAGDRWRVTVRRQDGTQTTVSIPLVAYPNRAAAGEAVFVIFIQILVPLFCLVLGYWVALARPADPNAWFILILLSYPQAFISVSTYNWLPGIWLPLRLVWHLALEILAPAALLFLGLLFPERSRIDVRFPWFKWLVLAVLLFSIGLAIALDYTAWYHFGLISNATSLDHLNDKLVLWATLTSIAVYWIAIFDKFRTASAPDSRRRLRLLCIGSVVGLGSVLFIFGVLPVLGIPDPSSIQWLDYLSAILMLTFPLSLAYVVVVQRAMDVRILLRIGTKYALARGTVGTVRAALLVLIAVFFWQTARAQHFGDIDIIRLVILALLLVLVSPRMFEPLSRWIDRRFFREAYNVDLVLSELSEQVRHFTDTVPLVETVSRRISDVLHVPDVSVLLRGDNGFHLCHTTAAAAPTEIWTPEQSPALRRALETNRPAIVDQDGASLDLQEPRTSAQVRPEVILPLPGRGRLMGVIALGPKLSEEPYSPSDLRVLQSVGVQTGLALEVSELAHSLAREASHRARLNREMEIARDVQQRFFPRHMPAIAGVDLAGACRPALGVGGDYYDIIELGNDRIGFAVGDVSGKGISAALLMASLRACLRTLTLVTQSAASNGQAKRTDLARLMRDMNRLVYESSEINRYATFFFGIYDAPARTFEYVNAGHNPPLLLKPAIKRSAIRLDVGGPVVGLLPDIPYTEAVLTFEPGDLLVAYTDGISEAMDGNEDEWSEQRMLIAAESLKHRSAAEVLRGIFAAADAFTGTAPQHDDMTLLVLKVS